MRCTIKKKDAARNLLAGAALAGATSVPSPSTCMQSTAPHIHTFLGPFCNNKMAVGLWIEDFAASLRVAAVDSFHSLLPLPRYSQSVCYRTFSTFIPVPSVIKRHQLQASDPARASFLSLLYGLRNMFASASLTAEYPRGATDEKASHVLGSKCKKATRSRGIVAQHNARPTIH